MKIRQGFVSNSSSSSFICKYCNFSFSWERGENPFFCQNCIENLKYPLTITLYKDDIKKLNRATSDIKDIFWRIIDEN